MNFESSICSLKRPGEVAVLQNTYDPFKTPPDIDLAMRHGVHLLLNIESFYGKKQRK